MRDRACEILPVHGYAHSVVGSLHPAGPDPGYTGAICCMAYRGKEAAFSLRGKQQRCYAVDFC